APALVTGAALGIGAARDLPAAKVLGAHRQAQLLGGGRLEAVEPAAHALAVDQLLAGRVLAVGLVDPLQRDVETRARAVGTGEMQPALALGLLFPPPAASALVLVGPHRARAGGAADGTEAALVQRIFRQLALADVLPDPGRAPGGQRVELPEWAPLHT